MAPKINTDDIELHALSNDYEPRIVIPWTVQTDIDEIVDTRLGEVGWIGECRQSEPGVFRVNKVTLPGQEANHSTTEITDQGLIDIMDQEPTFDMDHFRYWGHSHGSMTVGPSGQDDDQMKTFAKTCRWFVGTIHNKAGDVYGYIVDTQRGIYYKNVPVEYEEHPDITALQLEIQKIEFRMWTRRGELKKELSVRDWQSISNLRVKVKVFSTSSNIGYRGGYWDYDAKVWVKGIKPIPGATTKSIVAGESQRLLPPATGDDGYNHRGRGKKKT